MNLRSKLMALGATAALATAGAFLAPVESGKGGPQLTPYADLGGVPTWCYGETRGAPKPSYTAQECELLLLKALREHMHGIQHVVPQEAPESVQAGMLSVAYNTGVSGFLWELDASDKRVPSRFIKPLAEGRWEDACALIVAPFKGKHGIAKGYKATVKGKPVRGLENRRAKEYVLCRRDLR